MPQLRRIPAFLFMFVLIATSSLPAMAKSIPLADPQLRDARMYASAYGIGVDEAINRLQLQHPAGQLGLELAAKERDKLAGVWIQHVPQFRIIVQLTRGNQETIQRYIQGGPLANVVEVRLAGVTFADLEATQQQVVSAVQQLGVQVESGLNIFENRVELYVLDRLRFDAALQAAGITLPDTVTVITVPELSKPVADIYGGLPLSNTCTTGFSVRHSSGTTGITTAGHCNNGTSYNGQDLPWKDGRYYGSYDVQWHETPNLVDRPWFYDGQFTHTVTGTKGRDPLVYGEYVCKYGRTTGYGCGSVVDKNYTTCCSGNHTATFIRVSGNVKLAAGGDSGGPVFVSTISSKTAYGLIQAELGNDMIYMAINYISDLGLSVITG